MTKFMFIYHGGGIPEGEDAQNTAMAAWGVYMEKHGAAFADHGAPVGMSKTVSTGGVENHGGANPTSGYAFVNAASIEDACAIAAECPIITDGGSVEVAPIVEM